MPIRRMLLLIIGGFGMAAVIASLVLVVLASSFQDNMSSTIGWLHGLRLEEEMEIDLLTHARTRDEIVKAQRERSVRAKLAEASMWAREPEEQQTLASAKRLVDEYFTRGTPAFERAYAAIDGLVSMDIDDADAARESSERWGAIANAIAVTTAGMIVLGLLGVLLGTKKWLLEPIISIRNAMSGFAEGQRTRRAPEVGPYELRTIAKQFNAMSDALAEQHARQLIFLAGVAHDLRNPLSALQMSVAAANVDPLPPEERIRRSFEIVGRQVQRLDRMVQDLLDTARIESGHLNLKLELTDARRVAHEVVELFEHTSDKHELRLTAGDQPVMLMIDPQRVGQVLTNLVSNAIKYSPGGGQIRVMLAIRDGKAELSVADEGVGIDALDLPHIFAPFRRSPRTHEQIPGVGLGLSVARRIVEAHGGRILVESERHRGTTFKVELTIPSADDTVLALH